MTRTAAASAAFGRVEEALAEAAATLRRPAAAGWTGQAAQRFGDCLADELAALARIQARVPQVRAAVLRHATAADEAEQAARSAQAAGLVCGAG